MDFQQLIDNLTPEICASLRRAIEIGKWPDGRSLTEEQREMSMQAVIAYEAKFVSEEERVGFIDRGSKEDGETCSDQDSSILKWAE